MTRRIILFVLGIAAAGALLNLLTEEGGEVFFGIALLAAGVIVFLAGRARRQGTSGKFAATFGPHIEVELTLRRGAAPIAGRHEGVFAAGRNGFTVRVEVPVTLQPGVPQRVAAEFLKPEVALAHFSRGTVFSLLDGVQLLADGEVVAVLGQNALHEPGQGRRSPV